MKDLIIKDPEGEIKKLQDQINMHAVNIGRCEGAIALIQMKVKEAQEEVKKAQQELAEKTKQEVKK